jgi:hypothetical protein
VMPSKTRMRTLNDGPFPVDAGATATGEPRLSPL